MRKLFLEALDEMTKAFRRLEEKVPPPLKVAWKDGYVFRYEEKTIEQAILQKLARQVSGLYAIDALIRSGSFQEQGVIQRVLDEIAEDIIFLTHAILENPPTDTQELFLREFWKEEFDDPDPLKSTQKRGMVGRQKIRAHNSRALGDKDPSTANEAARTVHKAYSGFVHAASPQIMDMCEGDPPRFQLSGTNSSEILDEHIQDAWNYYYRGLVSVSIASSALQDYETQDLVHTYIAKFERISGTSYFSDTQLE